MDAAAELSSRGKHSIEVRKTMNDRDKRLHNPSAIKLHSAQNNLCDDLLMERFSQADMQTLRPESFHYFKYRGTQRFREALANFFTRKFKAHQPVSAENLIVSTGACTLFDLLAHSLADIGDYFMVLAPCYYGTPPDLESRAGVKSWFVQLPWKAEYDDIKTDLLTNELEKAKNQGVNIKGIVLCNPQNPTGKVYSPQALQDVLSFADRHNLHVIVDEIYALSVHQEGFSFSSILSLPKVPRPEMTHLVWGFSKDFGLGGIRCGVLHTWNQKFIQSLDYIMYLYAVPVMIQDKLTTLINDTKWVDTVFLPESRKRLNERYHHCTQYLQKLGVEVYPSYAGVFVWANFSKFLKEQTFDGVMELSTSFEAAGLKLAPGTRFYCDDLGWFRLTFARPREEVDTGLEIIKAVLEGRR